MHRPIKITQIILVILFSLVGILCLGLGVISYSQVIPVVNHLAPDGSMESYTSAFHQMARVPFLSVGIAGVLLVVLMVSFPKQTGHTILSAFMWLKTFLRCLWQDAIILVRKLFHPGLDWWELALLGGLVLLAFLARWIWIEKPMVHDESYTFIAFAKRPLIKVISDYHLPNNHILNSVLIHILYTLFGNPSPVIVRLPSFIAGVVVVPLVYVWSRKVYGRATAILGTTLVAIWPQLFVQSTNGRGYMIMGAFTMLMLCLGEIVRRSKNRAAWVLLVLVTALNFYTQPITLYPFCILGVWLFLSALVQDISNDYANFWCFFKYLFLYGFFTGVLTFLLHTPIFVIGTGWDSFFHNDFVKSLTWRDFQDSLPIRLNETYTEWINGVPVWLVYVLIAGLFFSILFHWRKHIHKIPLQLTIFLCLSVMFIIQRPSPWARTWTYLIPVVLVFCTAGLVFLVEFLTKKEHQKISVSVFTVFATIYFVFLGTTQLIADWHNPSRGTGQVEMVTEWLKTQVTGEDIVLTSMNFGPAFWYYFDRYQMPMNTIVDVKERQDWERAFLVVDSRENKSYTEIILDSDPVYLEDCPQDKVEPVHTYGNFTVYLCSK